MLKKLNATFVAVMLALICLLPFNLNTAKALADTSGNSIKGYETIIYLSEGDNALFKEISTTDIVLKVGNTEIYKNNEKLEAGNVYFNELNYGVQNNKYCFIKFVVNPTYSSSSLVLTVLNSDESVTANLTINFKDSYTEFNAPTYKALSDSAYTEYQVAINDEIENKEFDANFYVPSVERLLNLDLIPYSAYDITINYAIGADGWTTSTSNIKLSKEGTCRYFVTLKSKAPLENDNSDSYWEITTNGCQDYGDGMYTVYKKGTTTRVYARLANYGYDYFEDEEYETKYTGEVEQGELIAPIFSFTCPESSGPIIKKTSSYQEDGFIGLKYTISSLTVTGSINTVYTLEYSETGKEDSFTKAEETLIDNKSFVPTKEGYYRLKVEARDEEGNFKTMATSNIRVAKEYEVVEFKTSFKDWYQVNKMPFILLCISAGCLVGIIALIFIKPKDATKKVKVKEEDK